MKAKKQKAIWREIDARTGRAILPDAERARPYYLGALINLATGIEKVPTECSADTPEEDNFTISKRS